MFSQKKQKHLQLMDEFKKDTSKVTLYNLPPKVEFCKTCTMSNQKPIQTIEHMQPAEKDYKLTLDFKEGICHACRHKKSKTEDVDWEEKKHQFNKLLDKYRSRNGSYDVIIPGSGGKDSVMVSHLLKNEYNMNPLTVTWAPHTYTEIGWQNFIGL